MSKFRIAFGSASCRDNKSKNPQVQEICRVVLEKTEALQNSDPVFLRSFPAEHSEILLLNNQEVLLTVFHEKLPEEKSLIVIQAHYATWRFPNFLSFSGVGKVFVEGLQIDSSGNIQIAPESLLRSYR